MGGKVTRDEASLHYMSAKPIEISSRWSPALGDSGHRLIGDIPDLAAIGQFH